MSKIVLDMEWNQPIDPDSPLALRLCTTLPFEIIQIGAVRLEDGKRFKATCCLQQYRVLSPRISRLTGIRRQDVKNGETFQSAVNRFQDFCGEDPILLTWGFNDIPILRQNLAFYGLDTGLTNRSYNLQILFWQQFDPGPVLRGLSYAVEYFQIQAEDSYHDGLNDAAYTAQVAGHLDIARGMEEYPDYLKHFQGDGDPAFLDCLRYASYIRFESFESMISDPRLMETSCPRCGAMLRNKEPIFPDAGKILWTCDCPDHGTFMVRVTFKRNRDNSMRANKALFPFDKPHQEQYEKALQKASRPKRDRSAPFRLYIDADGCPVINQALNAANRRRVKCYLICDTAHSFSRRGAETIVVDKGADSTDFKIVELVQPGDLVLTQDYGLAAMCLARQARVIDQNGMRYTSENIQSLLTGRAESARLRRGGFRTKGPSKRTGEQNEAFVNAFHEMIQEAYDAAKKGEEAGELQSKENADG